MTLAQLAMRHAFNPADLDLAGLKALAKSTTVPSKSGRLSSELVNLGTHKNPHWIYPPQNRAKAFKALVKVLPKDAIAYHTDAGGLLILWEPAGAIHLTNFGA